MDKYPFSIVALVDANGLTCVVLNRPLNLLYERVGKDYIGSDGPFRNLLYYERGCGSFVAFAGRELTLQMKDGSVEKVKDHWWHGIPEGCIETAAGTVEELKKWYVFSGVSILKEEYENMRSKYSGCVYQYWDYEKIIKFDDMRRDLYRKIFYQERRCKNLIDEVKRKHRELVMR